MLNKLLFFILIYTISLPLFAVQQLSDTELATLRERFAKAEYAVKRPKKRQYAQLYRQLNNYPLQPYLELAFLKKRAYLAYEDRIVQFLDKYQQTPLDKPLRKKWLTFLAKKKHHAKFIRDYQPIGDVGLTCSYYYFQYLQNPEQHFDWQIVDNLWVVGRSQPKACDPLFKLWVDHGQRTTEKVLQRLEKAANKGKHTLIPYLKTLLPQKLHYLADLWHRMRRDPSQVRKLKSFKNTHPVEQDIAAYAIKRLIWRDKRLALATWPKLNDKLAFSETHRAEITKAFAIRLAAAKDKRATQWLEQVPQSLLDDNIIQWRVAHYLQHQDWLTIQDILQALPQQIATKQSWRYWLARSTEQNNAPVHAQRLYQKLAEERHYYGFLAAAQLNQPVALQNEPLQFLPQQIEEISHNPGAQRAFEWFALGRLTSARREWHALMLQLTPTQQQVASTLAYHQGWFDRPIFTLPKAGYLNDIELRFPLVHTQLIQTQAKKYLVDPALAFAIARRESSFMADARSSAGAIGLMQILPTTAKFVAKKSVSRRKLYQPRTNIKLGVSYLNYLFRKVDNNEVLATASYNAGIYRVKGWVNKKHPLPADIWIENIPFKETRDYVKSVLAYRQIYAKRLGQQDNLFIPLTTMNIGTNY